MGANLILPAGSAVADSTPAEDPVTRSLRFGSGAYLSRVFGTPTDAKKKTISVWVKRSKLNDSNGQELISYQDSNAGGSWQFSGAGGGGSSVNDDFTVNDRNATTGTADYMLRTKQLFRDPAAWYHIFIRFDTTDSTAADRCQIWVNGERVTDWNTGDLDYPDLNHVTTKIFAATTGNQYIGTSAWDTGGGFEGYMADFYFTDGTAYDVTDFAETDSTTGQWVPKTPTGLVYGNNGFHIDAQPAHDADLLVTSVGRNDGDTDFADAAKGRDVNVRGTPHHSIAVGNPFTGDGRAATLPATNGNLEIADHNDFDLGDTDWTVEGWFNLQNSGAQSLISKSGEWNIYYYSGEIRFYLNDSFRFRCYWTATLGKWHHIALCHDSSANDLQFYIDGEPISSNESSSTSSYSWPTGSGDLFINKWSDTYATQYTKEVHVYDVRVINGTKVYSGSFTPPSGKLTTTGGTYPSTTNVNTSITSSHTVLLIQPENSDTDFHDESDSSHTITGNGSPTRIASTPYEAAAKSTAIRLDSESLITETHTDFSISSSDTFTAEGWFYLPSSLTAYRPFFSTRHSGAVAGWQLSADSTASYWNFNELSGSGATSTTVALPSTGEWFHLAIVKNSNSTDGVSVYVNGALKFTATSTSSMTSASSLTIGDYWGVGYAAYYAIDAYTYDIRFSKNETRYSGTSTSDWGNFDEITAPLELNPVYLGADQSGNKNHFQPTNISSHDVMLDTPTKNYATWNPLDLQETASTAPTFTEGNLSLSTNSSGYGRVHSTISLPSTGKWYAEFYSTSFDTIGVRRKVGGGWPSGSSALATASSGGSIYNASGTSQSGLASWSSGDILGVEVDCDANTIQFLRNGSNYGTSESFIHYADETFFTYTDGSSGTAYNAIANFGQDPTFAGNKTSGQDSSQSEFYYAPPNDSDGNPFKSLNTSNLDAPSVTPAENFNTVIYAGNDTTSNPISGVGFQPDFTWIKNRTAANSNILTDALREATETLVSDNANPESTVAQGLKSFGSDGFTVGFDGTDIVNGANNNYVAWNWKAHQENSTSYSNTLTLDVHDNYGGGSGWGTTKLEVWEGSTKLTDITNPPSSSSKIYNIKTNDLDKIKIVWYVDGSAGDWYNMYAVLKNSSNTTLDSWDGNSWSGNSSDAPSDDDDFYLPSSFDSTNAATTGVVEAADADTERYNSSAGFTIIKYAGAGSTDGEDKTLDHSLGVPLEFVIAKKRTSNDGYDNGNWIVWHKDLSSSKYLYLDGNSAQRTESSGYNLISTTNSGTQHQVVVNNGTDGSSYNYHYLNSGPDNGTGEDYILYGWAGVEGMVKVGSWVGNGDDDGPMVYCGFRPSLILAKAVDRSNSWYMWDDQRDGHNVTDAGLWADLNVEESHSSTNKVDILSNGFKLRGSGNGTNSSSSNNYIFIAWAHSPFSKANSF